MSYLRRGGKFTDIGEKSDKSDMLKKIDIRIYIQDYKVGRLRRNER